MAGLKKVSSTSERLKFVMGERGLRAVDLSELTGFNKSTISNYLKGRYEPDVPKLKKLASALDVNELWLMGYEVPQRPFSQDVAPKDSPSRKELDELLDKCTFAQLSDISKFIKLFVLK